MMAICAHAQTLQSCLTPCDPMNSSSPGFSVHDIFQARILEWCHALLQGIFPTQGLNLGLPHCRQTLYRLSHQGSLKGEGYIYILRAIFVLFTLSLINGKILNKLSFRIPVCPQCPLRGSSLLPSSRVLLLHTILLYERTLTPYSLSQIKAVTRSKKSQ